MAVLVKGGNSFYWCAIVLVWYIAMFMYTHTHTFFSPGPTNAASDSATLSRPCSITPSRLQMREYLAWKEAHSGRKSSAEKHAGIQLDEDDVDEEDDDDLSGDNEDRGTDETGVIKGGEDAREKRGYSGRENDGEQEWAVEEEEVAARIEHRRVRMIRDVSFFNLFLDTTYMLRKFILWRIYLIVFF